MTVKAERERASGISRTKYELDLIAHQLTLSGWKWFRMTLTLTDSHRLKESNGLEPTTPEAVGDWWCCALVEMHTEDDGDDMWRQTYVVIYRRRACTTDHTADHQDCLWCYYPVFFWQLCDHFLFAFYFFTCCFAAFLLLFLGGKLHGCRSAF